MNNFSVTCFGTGDGLPCADRDHAAFLYRLGKTSILIDCGEAIDRNYKASGLSYNLLDAIFISHLHSDHFGGFFMLMQGMWLEGRRKPLPVYLPAGAIKPFRAMLEAAFLFDEVLPFQLHLRPLAEGKAIVLGNSRVTSFRTSHLDRTRARFEKKYRCDFSAFCFLIETAGRRIAHSSDLGQPQDLAPLLGKPLDLLICELSHFTPSQIFAYLKGRDIKQAAFIHLRRAFYEHLPRTRRLAAKILSDIPHVFPRDRHQIQF